MRRSSCCPDLGELLLASEGELPSRRSSAISTHLRGCPACRERLNDVSRTVHEVQELDDSLTTEALSRDWSAFHQRLRFAERAQAHASLRLPSHRWLAAAATVIVVVLTFLAFDRYATVVTAEELLTRAVTHERAQASETRQRVRIRLTPPAHASLRESDISIVTEVGAGLTSTSTTSDRFGQLASRLEQHRFRWNGAPSAEAFHAWRSTLSERKDSVFRPATQLLGLRTQTTDGWLREAVLIVREDDFHPVRQVLTFADAAELSVEEIASWRSTEPRTVVAVPATLPKRSVPVRSVDRLGDLELDVREKLHDLGADWRDGLSVRSTASRLVLEGRVPTETRHDELKTALSFPELVLNVAVDPSRAEARTLPAPSPRLETRLERVFPDARVRERFVPDAVRLVAELAAKSNAFAMLAQEYPSARASRLSDAAREKLRRLAFRHHRDLIVTLEELDRLLAPVFGTATRLSPSALSSDWQLMAGSLVSAARSTSDRLATWIASGDSDAGSLVDAALQEALDSCWAAVERRDQPTSPVPF